MIDAGWSAIKTGGAKPDQNIEIHFTVTEEDLEDNPIVIPDKEEVEMLACVIYQEAGGDMHCDDCRRRVADVVLNRIEDDRFPDTMYEVLTQRKQYGRYYYTGIVWPERADRLEEQAAVERAYRIAYEVLMGNHSGLYGEGYIYQAEFEQGVGIIYCDGMYFGR